MFRGTWSTKVLSSRDLKEGTFKGPREEELTKSGGIESPTLEAYLEEPFRRRNALPRNRPAERLEDPRNSGAHLHLLSEGRYTCPLEWKGEKKFAIREKGRKWVSEGGLQTEALRAACTK